MPLSKKISKKVARNVASTKPARKNVAPTVKTAAPVGTRKGKAVKPAKKVTKNTAKPVTRMRKKSTSLDVNFTPGTDMHIAFEEVLKGGGSRADVSHRLASMWSSSKTRNGNSKPVSTILNHVIRRALASKKYKIVQKWQVVPIDAADESLSVPVPSGVPVVATPKKVTKAVRKPNAVRTLAENAGVTKKPVKKVTKRRAAA